jgi:ribosome-binding factor A
VAANRGFSRRDRIAKQIRRELAEVIRTELRDPRVGMISLTDVQVSADYAHAKIFFSSLAGSDTLDAVQAGLQKAAGISAQRVGQAHQHSHDATTAFRFRRVAGTRRAVVEADQRGGGDLGSEADQIRPELTGRKSWRRVDGVLLLDKPTGMSSNSALQAARRLFSAAKAGHTGTLDPLASGLLPLCFGEATKFSVDLLAADKTYELNCCSVSGPTPETPTVRS